MRLSRQNFISQKSLRWTGVIAAILVAVVACGASGKKNEPASSGAHKNAGPPLAPLSYDPKQSLAPLVERVSPAVVNIKTSVKVRGGFGMNDPGRLFEFFFGPQGDSFGAVPPQMPEQQRQAMGSGFIIDRDGYVVTNHHVVNGADDIEVTLVDERSFTAEVVGSDERTDVALLKLKDASNLPVVNFGSSDALKVGDHVVAIGNPFGLDHTVTSGIVSAKERVIGAGPYDDFIQTDASINPGNSGGPLFNLAGEVVGINTAITRTGQGIGFAIPSDLARGLIDSIREKGKVVRGWLGIVFQPLDKELAAFLGAKDSSGALVTRVNPGSPGEKGGLKERDVILEVDGRKLNSSRDLPALVAGVAPGRSVPFRILRNAKEQELSIAVGDMPEDFSEEAGPAKAGDEAAKNLGFSVAPLDDRTRTRLGADGVTGVVVTGVAPDGPAKALARGDIIVEVNRKPVSSVEEFRAASSSLRKGDQMLLRLFRRGGWLYAIIRLQ